MRGPTWRIITVLHGVAQHAANGTGGVQTLLDIQITRRLIVHVAEYCCKYTCRLDILDNGLHVAILNAHDGNGKSLQLATR